MRHLEAFKPSALADRQLRAEHFDPGASTLLCGSGGTEVSLDRWRAITGYKKNRRILREEMDTHTVQGMTASQLNEHLTTRSLQTTDPELFPRLLELHKLQEDVDS